MRCRFAKQLNQDLFLGRSLPNLFAVKDAPSWKGRNAFFGVTVERNSAIGATRATSSRLTGRKAPPSPAGLGGGPLLQMFRSKRSWPNWATM